MWRTKAIATCVCASPSLRIGDVRNSLNATLTASHGDGGRVGGRRIGLGRSLSCARACERRSASVPWKRRRCRNPRPFLVLLLLRRSSQLLLSTRLQLSRRFRRNKRWAATIVPPIASAAGAIGKAGGPRATIAKLPPAAAKSRTANAAALGAAAGTIAGGNGRATIGTPACAAAKARGIGGRQRARAGTPWASRPRRALADAPSNRGTS